MSLKVIVLKFGIGSTICGMVEIEVKEIDMDDTNVQFVIVEILVMSGNPMRSIDCNIGNVLKNPSGKGLPVSGFPPITGERDNTFILSAPRNVGLNKVM